MQCNVRKSKQIMQKPVKRVRSIKVCVCVCVSASLSERVFMHLSQSIVC